MINTRKYYSVRTGKSDNSKITLDVLRRLVKEFFVEFESKYYFQEYYGYNCIDQGFVPGKLGVDIEATMFKELRKENLWPIIDKYLHYTEEDLFDVVEFIYDTISQPIDGQGTYHSYGDCGWHYVQFNALPAKREFLDAINSVLADYSVGYKLTQNGEIQTLPEKGLNRLLDAKVITTDPENIDKKIEMAIGKYLSYRSSIEERRNSVRELADVLEFLRPKAKEVLDEKDESDLFNIINNFAIRHHNEKQKRNYDPNIWLSWMFYFNLSTIYAIIHLLKKKDVRM